MILIRRIIKNDKYKEPLIITTNDKNNENKQQED